MNWFTSKWAFFVGVLTTLFSGLLIYLNLRKKKTQTISAEFKHIKNQEDIDEADNIDSAIDSLNS